MPPPENGRGRRAREPGDLESITLTERTGTRITAAADIVPYCPVFAGAARSGDASVLAAAARLHRHGRADRYHHVIGCPCGHVADEDCIRRRPIGEPRQWGGYDVRDLGLAWHDRDRCPQCQAVGA